MGKRYAVTEAVDIIRAVQSRLGIYQARNDIYQRALEVAEYDAPANDMLVARSALVEVLGVECLTLVEDGTPCMTDSSYIRAAAGALGRLAAGKPKRFSEAERKRRREALAKARKNRWPAQKN